MTNSATLTLSTGEKHASGFWAEEFVLPYQIFKQEGYEVDVATIGGLAPSVDKTSIDPNFMPYVRPVGSQVDDTEQAREFMGDRVGQANSSCLPRRKRTFSAENPRRSLAV